MPRGIPNKTTRTSREQETWDAAAVDRDYSDISEDTGPLPDIPPREGFSQRWMRTKIGGEDDPKNISSSINKGWRRRDPATIPPEFSAPSIYVDGIGDSVGISGFILVERPEKMSSAYKQRVRQRTDSQMQAVNEALKSTHAAQDNSGFGPPKATEEKTTVTRGVLPIDD